MVFFLLGAILFLAPVVRGGNRELALSALLALALACLALVLARTSHAVVTRQALPAPQQSRRWWLLLALACSPLALGLLQLYPVNAEWWATLAGRQDYLQALGAAGGALPASLPLSLNPGATWASMWSALPLSAALLGGLVLRREQLERLLLVLLAAGVLQVLLAVAQFAGGKASLLYFGRAGQGFIGSFANRNHLADFLAMLVPLWFYWWWRLHRHEDASESGRLARMARAPLLLALGFSLLVVILSTQSRGGILATLAVLLLSAGVYVYAIRQRLRRWQMWALAGLFLLFVVLALAAIDVKGLATRLEGGRLQTDAELRNTLALATWDAARAFWPWGSGMGTFESVFPRFQPAQVAGYVNHAHNDYPQLLMELGAPALLMAGVLLVLALRQGWALLASLRAGRRLSSDLALRCFAGLGALALLLHSWVEFNMHIPALAITASFLLGVFLRPLPGRG